MKIALACLAIIVALGLGIVIGRQRPAEQPAPGSQPQSTEDAKPGTKTEVLSPAPAGFKLSPASHDFGKLFEGEARSVELAIERPSDGAFRMGRLYTQVAGKSE